MTNDKPRSAPETRKFSIGKHDLNAHARNIETIREMWHDKKGKEFQTIEFYYDKILEEVEEFVEGEDETPTINKDTQILTTTGDSRFAEAPTVLLTVLHWATVRSGLSYSQILGMLEQRFREQAWRHHVLKDVDEELVHKSKGSFEDGTYWLLRFSRDNRIFGAKVEWTQALGSKLREVVDLNTEFHWSKDGKFTLPVSYEPYMDVQRYTFLGTAVRGIVFDDGQIVEFFNPRGVELIHEPRDGKYISASDAEWQKPKLGDFTGMQYP